jgi:hypothetical protein
MLVVIVQAAMDVATCANCFKVIADIKVQAGELRNGNSDREASRSEQIHNSNDLTATEP